MKTGSPLSNQLLQKDLPLVTEASHLVRGSLSDKGEDVSEALNTDNGLSTGRTDLRGVGVGRDEGTRHGEAQRWRSETSGRAANSSKGAPAPSLGGCG